jgi:hypothetical protein
VPFYVNQLFLISLYPIRSSLPETLFDPEELEEMKQKKVIPKKMHKLYIYIIISLSSSPLCRIWQPLPKKDP